MRQVDPVRGHSPWQRGVRGDQQVLVCPDCQAAPGLADELDNCRRCGGIRLVRRLGEVECRACGFVVSAGDAPGRAGEGRPRDGAPGPAVAGASGPAGDTAPGLAGDTAPGLAEEVAQALERVLRRHSRVPPASAALP